MKYKAVCFDLDGTLLNGDVLVWQAIHDHLNINKEERKYAMERFMRKEITYEEWAKEDVRLWKNVGATKESVLSAVDGLTLVEGAREVLSELKKRGIVLGLISGSLDVILEYKFPEYKNFFKYVYINKLLFDEKNNIKDISPTMYDFEHKVSALREIAEKERISLKEIVFVGDHVNDIDAAMAAGLSVAFNSRSDRLNQVCGHVIKDLKELLEVMDKYD